MATKGQKFKKFGPEVKEAVLRRYFAGEASTAMLSEEYGVPRETVKTWIKKTKRGVDVTEDRRKGRVGRRKDPANATKEDLEEQVEILKKYQAFLKARTGKK